MARTHRSIPHWALKHKDDDLDGYHPSSARKMKRFNQKLGRDGAIASDVGEPNANSPKGYERWNTYHGPNLKRYAKRHAAQINRRVAARELQGVEVLDT